MKIEQFNQNRILCYNNILYIQNINLELIFMLPFIFAGRETNFKTRLNINKRK